MAGRLTSSGWIGSATSTDDSLSVPRMVRACAEPSNLAFTTARARRVSDVLLRGAARVDCPLRCNVGDLCGTGSSK